MLFPNMLVSFHETKNSCNVSNYCASHDKWDLHTSKCCAGLYDKISTCFSPYLNAATWRTPKPSQAMRSLTSTTCIPPTAHRPQSFQSFRKQILWKKHNVWRAGYRKKTLRIMPTTQTDTATSERMAPAKRSEGKVALNCSAGRDAQ